jgi:hypothetical protein
MSTPRIAIHWALLVTAAVVGPGRCPAAVAPSMPQNIVVSNMNEHGDLVFILYVEGQFEKGYLLDPQTAEESGLVRLPVHDLPQGKLALLAVPRALVEQGHAPDPAWLAEGAAGILGVSGVIHHLPVEKSSMLHQYELGKTEDGLKITLLNPDVLTPYPPEPWMLEDQSPASFKWGGVAGAAAVVLIGICLFLTLKRRGAAGDSVT